ncbi:conserved hypothetical protein [Allorhizobium ampelinum S4]|uniref:TIGR02301 family protein n=2 Tax=Rhizobium/Agrobacterium group TaxID=227290 RepID=B9JUQ0_ALLAM|nr:conserved hypothetical protein [Allorhizobium ampelinum S4]
MPRICMTRPILLFPALCTVSVLMAGLAAAANVAPPAKLPGEAATPAQQATPYDGQLNRLSEILGTVTYLRNLCAGQPEQQWRAVAEKLIALDAGTEPVRKQMLTAAYNRGYRAFAAVHPSCTSAARVAESQYRAEGATLVREMTARFGN